MTKSRFHEDLKIQFGLTHDCVRACVFFDHIVRVRPQAEAWISFVDICYTDAVLTWTQLFGSNGEETHWKHFLSKFDNLPENLRRFSSDRVCAYLEIEMNQWEAFHARMVNARNKRLAHIDRFYEMKDFPGLDWAARSCYIYREWLLLLLNEVTEPNSDPQKEPHSGPEMIALFQRQIAEICPDAVT